MREKKSQFFDKSVQSDGRSLKKKRCIYLFLSVAKIKLIKKSRFRAPIERNIALDSILIQADRYSKRTRSITPTLFAYKGEFRPRISSFSRLSSRNVPLPSPIPQTHDETLRAGACDRSTMSLTLDDVQFTRFSSRCRKSASGDRQELPIGNGTRLGG